MATVHNRESNPDKYSHLAAFYFPQLKLFFFFFTLYHFPFKRHRKSRYFLEDTQMAEEEGIGLVLARATELRSKVANCMNSVTASAVVIQNREFGGETQHLLNICGALETLESQLSSLQVMKQNHRHEREAALAEIDYSRRVLLDQLKDYKGEDMELIWEASDFAGQTVDYETTSSYKVLQSGTRHRTTNIIDKPSRNQTRRFIHLIGRAAKAAFTLVGIISLLSFANIRSSWHPNMKSVSRSRTRMVQCPPSKVKVVLENGRVRCVVKERVEVPFESFVEIPAIDYGCG